MNKMRSGLPPLPQRMRSLRIDERGYPVPFFAEWVDGKPDHRIADGRKYVRAVKFRLCWVCGEPLGRFGAFVIGPMCAINRTSAEPPAHRDCALYSVQACPFLSRPHAKRREYEGTDAGPHNVGGIPLLRNPGVTAVWVTASWTCRQAFAGNKGVLHHFGDPIAVTWWCEGRAATRAEVLESIDGGLPALRQVAELQDVQEPGVGAVAHLEQSMRIAETFYPPEVA